VQITKFGHACVRVSVDAEALVVDPGVFTEPEAVDGATAVLVTHEHPDHFDPERLRRCEAPIWTNAGVAEAMRNQASDLADRTSVIAAGDSFTAAGLPVTVHGSQHALIHVDLERVANTAYLIADTLYHPGDSFTAPPHRVETLLVPIHAPWMPVREAVDFARAYARDRAVAIHDGLLNDNGLRVVSGVLSGLLDGRGIEYKRLASGSDV
jgi:L-ascorbate metabolism protein UlaG (beta-lactamase superfamily)